MIQSSYVCFLVMFVIGRRGCGEIERRREGGGREREGEKFLKGSREI